MGLFIGVNKDRFSPDAENLLADLWDLTWTAVLSSGFEGGTGLTKVGFFSSVFERNCEERMNSTKGWLYIMLSVLLVRRTLVCYWFGTF